jgi:hypothetical protein
MADHKDPKNMTMSYPDELNASIESAFESGFKVALKVALKG